MKKSELLGTLDGKGFVYKAVSETNIVYLEQDVLEELKRRDKRFSELCIIFFEPFIVKLKIIGLKIIKPFLKLKNAIN